MEFKIVKKLDHFTIDVSYRFDSGILAVQGESGAGKTTLLNCIAGLSEPDEGQIVIGEKVVFDKEKGIQVPTRLRALGYLFQNYGLFPNMTVQQNIVYGIKNKEEYKDRAKRKELLQYADYIMETFGIAHLKAKHPNQISGGEKQRAALSRAIVTKPKLLLLDEPFSALDMRTKEVIYQEFASFKREFKIPTILITHDAAESELFADQRILMKDGKILEEGKYEPE